MQMLSHVHNILPPDSIQRHAEKFEALCNILYHARFKGGWGWGCSSPSICQGFRTAAVGWLWLLIHHIVSCVYLEGMCSGYFSFSSTDFSEKAEWTKVLLISCDCTFMYLHMCDMFCILSVLLYFLWLFSSWNWWQKGMDWQTTSPHGSNLLSQVLQTASLSPIQWVKYSNSPTYIILNLHKFDFMYIFVPGTNLKKLWKRNLHPVGNMWRT